MTENQKPYTKISSLPNESLYEIFHYLEKDLHTLYSCLQVDRFWCKQVVSFLWQNPMPNTYTSVNLGVYMKFFEDQEKLELEQNHGINIKEIPYPLFNYERYLRVLNLRGIRHATFYWLKNYRLSKDPFFDECIDFNQNSTIDLIEKALLKLLLKNAYKIKHLVLDLSRRYRDIPDDSVNLFTSEEYPGIRNISKFSFINNTSELCFDNVRNLLEVLPTLCKKINKLKLYYLLYWHEVYETNLVKLIKSQQQLTSFDLTRGNVNISRILMVLKDQATSLKKLTFNRISFMDFVYFSFEHLINLEYLEIEGYHPIDFILFPLSKANLKLKYFKAKFIENDYDLKESILKSSRDTLENLYLEVFIPRIEKKAPLCNVCPNLTHFKIELCILDKIPEHITIFLNYINNLKKLTHLSIKFSCNSNNEILDKFDKINLPCLKFFSFKFEDYSLISLKKWFKHFSTIFNRIIFYVGNYLDHEQIVFLNFFADENKNNFTLIRSENEYNFKFVAINSLEL